MENRRGRAEPPVVRVRTDRDSPEWETEGYGSEWKTGQDGSEWETEQESSEWETEGDGSEWETGRGSPEWKTERDRRAAAGYGNKRQKRERRHSGSRNAGARIRHAAVSVLLAAVVTVFLGAVGFLILQISGKSSLYSRADSSSLVSALSEITVELGDDVQDDGTEDWK